MNMLQVIKRGAVETLAAQARRNIPLPCNCCGHDAPLASRDTRMGYYTIVCENEDCALPLCVEGDTLGEVWANWNNRVSA